MSLNFSSICCIFCRANHCHSEHIISVPFFYSRLHICLTPITTLSVLHVKHVSKNQMSCVCPFCFLSLHSHFPFCAHDSNLCLLAFSSFIHVPHVSCLPRQSGAQTLASYSSARLRSLGKPLITRPFPCRTDDSTTSHSSSSSVSWRSNMHHTFNTIQPQLTRHV